MLSRTTRSALAAIAIAVAALGSAAVATAAPAGPCRDVPYVGVCEPLRGDSRTPSQQQSMGDVILPGSNSAGGVHGVG
ncbi:hypothetical protein [Mycolicibacterium sp. XJ1819]